MAKEPIIIIGAGRSGTNILRDTICRIEGFETWPCDEINYIWRHRNLRRSSDRFTAEDASSSVVSYIKREFLRFQRLSGAQHVVEKTCANSLRVPFINKIFPDARFIFLIREGKDVASSARQRWTARLEPKYILKKARYIPSSDIAYYGIRYFYNRIKKVFSKEKRLAFWGPIYPGMMNDLKTDTLIEVCGKQWKECTEIAYNDLSCLDPTKVHMMTYEAFVSDPKHEMRKVMEFLNKDLTNDELDRAIGKVSSRSVGNYKKHLTNEELDKLNKIVEPVMLDIYQKVANNVPHSKN